MCLTARVYVYSVLEPSRTLTLAEKGGAGAEVITAAPGFRLVGTMNPGGDYGKKELSPALSNRFTQIWVPPIEEEVELAAIVQSRLTGVMQSNSSFLRTFLKTTGIIIGHGYHMIWREIGLLLVSAAIR